MLQPIDQLRSKFSTSTRDRSDESSGESGDRSTDTGTSLLHECPGCGEVYLSEGPRDCSSCERQTVPVER